MGTWIEAEVYTVTSEEMDRAELLGKEIDKPETTQVMMINLDLVECFRKDEDAPMFETVLTMADGDDIVIRMPYAKVKEIIQRSSVKVLNVKV